jgi:hypothetical protein
VTLLEKFLAGPIGCVTEYWVDVKRAIAVAQAVEEIAKIGAYEIPTWIMRRADELLKDKP